MALIESTIIVADDLTGANDTALQFFKKGLNTKIIIDYNEDYSTKKHIDVWAISTESRNIEKEVAVDKVYKIVEKLKQDLNVEKFYKKIDSTLRGNTGLEIFAMLEATQNEVAIVAPAYIEEGRATLGGYQILNGMVIERTQCALDPKAPIFDSYIPDILKKDLNSQLHDLIGTIGFNIITKGAGPIALKINELVQLGKKIIVVDAMSDTDLNQIALAINKSPYNILPCGSAGLANAINKIQGENIQTEINFDIPKLPRIIISGSATQLALKQIGYLKENNKDMVFIDLEINDILQGVNEEIVNKINNGLILNKDVVIHSSYINNQILDEEGLNQLIDAGIAKAEFPGKITDYLANLANEINLKNKFILILVGGETSFKCATEMNTGYLKVLDAILPAVPLCEDKHGKFIVTKSGNFGQIDTLSKIIDYFNEYNEKI